MPVQLQALQENGISFALWKIDETEAELREAYHSLIAYPMKLPDYKAESRRREWYAARLALVQVLGTTYQFIPGLKKTRPQSIGKGEMAIAHTSAYAIVATHPQFRVAVDIENLKRKVRAETPPLAMNDREVELIRRHGDGAFLQIWTAKECVYKLLYDQHPEETLSFRQHLDVEPTNWFHSTKSGKMQVDVNAPWHRERITCNWLTFDGHIISLAKLAYPVQTRRAGKLISEHQ